MRKLQLTELNRKSKEEFKASPKWPVVIILDNVRSALNVGSIFRSADAFLVEKIYLCGITASPPNKEIAKSALGATDTVQWQYIESSKIAVEECKLKNYSVVSVEQTTESQELKSLQINGPLALVFGNEVNGVSDEVLALSDCAVEIPQFGTKHSFNVAVCTGIVLYSIYEKIKA